MKTIDKERKFSIEEVVELLTEINTDTCDCPAMGICGQYSSCDLALMA